MATRRIYGELPRPLIFCQDGAWDFFKINDKIAAGKGSRKSSKKLLKMINQKQYLQAL